MRDKAFQLHAPRSRRAVLRGGALYCGAVCAAAPLFAKPASNNRGRIAVRRNQARLQDEMSALGLRLGAPVFLRITKKPAILEAFAENANGAFASFRQYPICSFSGAPGPKLRTGDGQAPEGFYAVGPGQMNPYSDYHLSFNLGYPNAFDRAHGRTGSALMVHGACVSIGCYAMGDAAIEEIWTLMMAAFQNDAAPVRVHAFPFPMTKAALDAQAANPNTSFWANLKEGWDWFGAHGRPPDVRVSKGRYTFRAS